MKNYKGFIDPKPKRNRMTTNLRRQVWAEINRSHFAHNISLVKRRLDSKTRLLLVLKADAYGHGASALARVGLEQGAHYFGVATLDEALELKEALVPKPGAINLAAPKILIMGYTPPSSAKEAIEENLELCLYELGWAMELDKIARGLRRRAKVHLKLDTGMNRLGYQLNAKSLSEIERILSLDNIEVVGLFTHFATADSMDLSHLDKQHREFLDFVKAIKGLGSFKDCAPILHSANSAAILSAPQSHGDMVRLGIMAYGLRPSLEMDMKGLDLRAVMSFKARVVCVKDIEVGGAVSYGRRFIAPKKTRIAVLPVGYADGYMRLLSNKACVLIRGQRARVVGAICMDHCMVDISEIPGVMVGDCALLFGEDNGAHLSVDEVASHLGSINYELVCAVSKRVYRVYVD